MSTPTPAPPLRPVSTEEAAATFRALRAAMEDAGLSTHMLYRETRTTPVARSTCTAWAR
ncbi:hypothetical protein [Streptomyces sp.]|uniref:hypothetical protein n=1 Tax=Streptomyces sp. TaxID=1931 RepID=UPI002811A85C|nr:hypothetical protein [Streptomyces sp.]